MERIDANITDREDLREYLVEHYRRAKDARDVQLTRDYPNWDQIYRAVPSRTVRDIPWRNSSNFVVPVVRMFVDTFVARTLNVVFATRPLIQVHGGPSEPREGLEAYLNIKAVQHWNIYELSRGALYRGNKYGTGMVKVPHVTEYAKGIAPNAKGGYDSVEIPAYSGPKPDHIAFDDWFLYPFTANSLDQAEIVFHRVRYTEEAARRKIQAKVWDLSETELGEALKEPDDVKREKEKTDAGVADYQYRELQMVECHLEWDDFRIIAELEPRTGKMVGVYHNPNPPQVKLFHAYRPFPRDDMFTGESACDVLGQAQEEISSIHNERRNLSVLAAAPQFIRKDGARVPDATTGYYPGKVWVVDEMDDFRIEQVQAGYQDMIQEETQALMLAERVSGVGGIATGSSQGQMGKGGVYNAAGTLAVMAESNQRQNTNIRDFRLFAGGVVKDCFLLQQAFAPDDPTLKQLPEKQQQQAREALEMGAGPFEEAVFEVRVSDSAANKEMEKANLMTAANILSQYGQQMQGLVSGMHAQNPVIQQLSLSQAAMQHAMARELAQALELSDIAENLPNAAEIFQQVQQQQHAQQQQQADPGAMGSPGGFGQQ